MAKPSKEKIIAELDARKIAYREDMSYDELAELLKTEEHAPMEPRPAVVKEPDIDVSKARCGLETIHDHERRIVQLERLVAKIERLRIEASQHRQSPV